MHQILLVEDNLGDALLIEEALNDSDLDLNVNIVHDGEKALEYLRKENEFYNTPCADLIILDINIPKKDGVEVFHEIKNDTSLKHHSIMVLTSSPYEQDILKEKDLSPYCYVIKPSSLATFNLVTDTIKKFFHDKKKCC